MSTTVPINNQLSINIATLVNNNQSNLNTSISWTVTNYTANTGFTVNVNFIF